MDFLNKCAEGLENFFSWLNYFSIIVPIMLGVIIWNFWNKEAAIASFPTECRAFFKQIPLSGSFKPVVYGKSLSLGIFYFWKKIVIHKEGIEVRNIFFDSMSEFIKHEEILRFRFVFPVDGFTPLWLEVIKKNSHSIQLIDTYMPCASTVLVELKTRNPELPWTKQETKLFGMSEDSIL